MSIESMAIALHHSRAKGATKLVLLGIANHDGDGGSWPSVETLQRYAGINRRNTQKAIGHLEALGEIRRHLQDGGTASYADHLRPNRYEFVLQCPAGCDRSARHEVTPGMVFFESVGELIDGPWGVASDTPPRVASDTPPRVASDAQTVLSKPSNNRPMVLAAARTRRPSAAISQKQADYLRHMADVIRSSGRACADEWSVSILDGLDTLNSTEATSRIDEWMGFYREAGGGISRAGASGCD